MSKYVESTTGIDVVWGLIDQVNLLKTIFYLEKMANNAYAHGTNEEIETKKEKLRHLLFDNALKRVARARENNIDEHFIKTVMKDEKTQRLSLQHLSIQKAIAAKDARLFDSNKMVDLIRYVQRMRTEKLNLLTEQLNDLQSQVNSTPIGYDKTKAILTSLENSLDKAMIKYNTSRVLTKKYRELIDQLREEGVRMPAKLDEMEHTLRETRTKIKYFKQVVVEANNEEDIATKQLARLEQNSLETRRKREADLTAVRKKIDQMRIAAIGERMDKRNIVRVSLLDETAEKSAANAREAQDKQQQQVIVFTDKLREVMAATKVSKFQDIVSRVQSEREFHDRLETMTEELKTRHHRLVGEHASLKFKYNTLKYSGLSELKKRDSKFEAKKEKLTTTSTGVETLSEELESKGHIVVQLRRGFDALEEKLKDIDVDPPKPGQSELFARCELCMNKLEALMKSLDEANAPTLPPLGAVTEQHKFEDYVEKKVQANNVRVKFCSSETSLSEFSYDLGIDDPECLTATDIKRISNKLIDSKTRKNKRRPKKK
ncbi:hypothetical protein NP493_73g05060 [Ridgeia piscesae]|uniref:Uncharacterized protein n=1 Tax=Ridgeia piscesae TaxID=27915 RepID=A0AAD9P9R3_RIDPI|nr:hypothetical protein NP493_73g05060 [Ridgeia piscesae]